MGDRRQLTAVDSRIRYRRPVSVFGSTIRRLGSTGSLGLVGVAVSLVLLLAPVHSQYTDPCGSILVPARTWYSDGGELVHRNTPPCRDARMGRLWWAAPIGVVGLVGVGFALRPRRHPDAENS